MCVFFRGGGLQLHVRPMGRQEKCARRSAGFVDSFPRGTRKFWGFVAAEHGVLLRLIFIFVSILNHACYQDYSFIHIVFLDEKERFVLCS